MVDGKPSRSSRVDAKKESSPRNDGQTHSAIASGRSLGNIRIINALQHTERDVFYSTYWESQCLPALHPLFHSISCLASDKPMLKDAILALSSCNLSRLSAEKRLFQTGNMGSFSPSLIHQTRSQLYYSSAIRKFTSLDPLESRQNTAIILAVQVLFAYFESSMGNFHGFNCHVQGMSDFLKTTPSVSTDITIQSILTAWMQVRFVVWWARAYFSSLDIQQQILSVPLPTLLPGFAASLDERRVEVLGIMCESHRLNFASLFQYWDPGPVSCLENDTNQGSSHIQLAEESEKMDKWLSRLPSSEEPTKTNVYAASSNAVDDNRNALYFLSHKAALNYAYYVVGRIMQCKSLLRNLQSLNSQIIGHECHEEEYWIRLLLRIATGTNLRTSLTENNYTIGFTGLLLAAILRCQNISLGIEIQDWLGALAELQPTEEGAFPVYQTLGVVKAINFQKSIGRDVFAITLPLDDGGGMPKFTAYSSQLITTLVFYGKSNITGDLFAECVTIKM
jgi:hypothetical protein